MNFRVLPVADGEAIATAIWYEDRRPGLADDFFTQMRSAFELIRQDPLSAPKLEYYSGPHEIRRRMLHRFPYAVVYLFVLMKSWLLLSRILAGVRCTGWIASTEAKMCKL